MCTVCVFVCMRERELEANDFDVQVLFVCIQCPQHSWVLMCVLSLSGCCDYSGRVGGFPLRQLTLATKQIANIACLAFSGGNKPIDF